MVSSKEALELQSQLLVLKESVTAEAPTIDELRIGVQMLGSVATEPDGVEVTRVDLGGCEGLRHVPSHVKDGFALLWLHGGGYGLLSAETHSRMCGHMAEALEAEVFALDFRRAPEHTFPAALDDAVNAYAWLRAHGYTRVVLGGDSAGAGHAVATMLAVEQLGRARPDAAILISGWYDLKLTYPSLTERFDRDLTNSAVLMAMLRDNYLAGHDVEDPLVSPMFGDLSGLPRCYMTVSEEEILFDDTIFFAENARKAGVDVELEVIQVMPHVHTLWAGSVPEADESIDRIAHWLG